MSYERGKSRQHGKMQEKILAFNKEEDLHALAIEVIKALKEKNLPPVPENFTLFFDRTLETKNADLQQQVRFITPNFEKHQENEFEYEKSLNNGIKSVKSILHHGSNVYKQTALLKKTLKNKKAFIEDNRELASLIEVAASIEHELEMFLVSLEGQALKIKDSYGSVVKSVNNAKRSSIYNSALGVYNKRYLLTLLEKERTSCIQFGYKSSLIAISLAHNVSTAADNKNNHAVMIRSLAKMLLNAIRRSDIIAYAGDGIFAILLRHTDLENAQQVAERLYSLTSQNYFTINKTDKIPLKTSIGISQIHADTDKEEILELAVAALRSADAAEEGTYCKIAEVTIDTATLSDQPEQPEQNDSNDLE